MPLKPDSQGQLWCCLILRKLTILRTVQPSPSRRDSPSFAWKFLIPTSLSIRKNPDFDISSDIFLLMISDRNCPLKTLEWDFRASTFQNFTGEHSPRPPWWPLPSAIAWFVRWWSKTIPISHPHMVGLSDNRNSAFVFFFQVFEFQMSLFQMVNRWFLFFVDFSTLKTISNQILSEKGNLVQHSPIPSITLLKSMQPWDSLKRVQCIAIQPCFVSWRLDSMTQWTGP